MFSAMMASSTIKLVTQSDPDFWGGFLLTGPFDHAEEGYKTKDKRSCGACRSILTSRRQPGSNSANRLASRPSRRSLLSRKRRQPVGIEETPRSINLSLKPLRE